MNLSENTIYVLEKVKCELEESDHYFFSIMKPNFTTKGWSNLNYEERESLYKIRIPFTVIAVLLRKMDKFRDRFWDRFGDIKIQTVRRIQPREDISKILFTKGEVEKIHGIDAENLVQDSVNMKEIYNYIIHERRAGYTYAESNDKILELNDLPMIYFNISTDRKEEISINIEDFLTKLKNRVDLLLEQGKKG